MREEMKDNGETDKKVSREGREKHGDSVGVDNFWKLKNDKGTQNEKQTNSFLRASIPVPIL